MEDKKKCPYCQSDININASVCPNCGKGVTVIDMIFKLIGSLAILAIGLYFMHIGGIF